MSEEFWNKEDWKDLDIHLHNLCDLLYLPYEVINLSSLGFIDLLKHWIDLRLRDKKNQFLLTLGKELGIDHIGLINESLDNLKKRLG